MKDTFRKSDSLVTSALKIREDMKEAQGKYNDYVSELAMLTKGELKQVMNGFNNKPDDNTIDSAISIFDRLEETLLILEDTQASLDEIVSIVGGLEFSTDTTTTKLRDIMVEQDGHQKRMTKAVSLMHADLEELKSDDEVLPQLLEDMGDFMEEFARYQDYAVEAVPRMTQLFDELDREEQIGKRYGENV
ncbi:MAG: hypothetical protein INQ03_18345 [Candidatus Heimdallarchaeota archaeon]|nr:hypothetical protein [Candidatus Heimdallarchaeota archaeon]